MKHDGGWKRTASKYLYQSQWFHLRQDSVDLPSGDPITYTMVEHPGYVLVAPLRGDGMLLFESIYRYTIQETLLEFPSGGIEKETPRQAALRELEEETGWIANSLTPLGDFYGSKGISDEQFHVFLATDLEQTGNLQREPTEQMEIVFMPLEQALDALWKGELKDAPTALALHLLERHLGEE